jgi:hypothetical protein
MIACPHCQHVNPEGATHCEACFQELPTLIPCPHCGAEVQSDAIFCGQCGNAIATRPPSTEPNPEPLTAAVSEQNSANSAILSPSALVPNPLQREKAYLFHEKTRTALELPPSRAFIHLGKPNDRVPPDLDLSGLPHADIVSRVHADIRVEGDRYFLEDTGSANGTYLNHKPLPPGDRQLLQSGDRIALGKEDLVTFLFQSGE